MTLPAAPLPNPSPELFQLVRDTSTYNNRLPTPPAQHYAHPPSPYVAPVSRNETPAETVIDVQSGLPADLVDPPPTSVPGVPNTSVPIDEQTGLPGGLGRPTTSDPPCRERQTPTRFQSMVHTRLGISTQSTRTRRVRKVTTLTRHVVASHRLHLQYHLVVTRTIRLRLLAGLVIMTLKRTMWMGVFYDGSDEGATDPSYVNALRPNYV